MKVGFLRRLLKRPGSNRLVGDTMSITSSATVDEVDTTPNELFCNIGEYIDCLGDKK